MTFQWPLLLLAVLLVPAGAWAAATIERRRRARVTALAGSLGRPAAGSGAAGPTPAERLLGRLPAALVTTALVVLAVGLARPEATVALPRLEGTLMLVFDVSGSMAADDVAPNRMEAAKAIATSIVARRPEGVVIGVVAFSDAGVAVQAPTRDTGEVEAAIARLAPTRGTSVGGGILAALAAIEEARADTPAEYYSNRSPEPRATPVPAGSDTATLIVVLSDGENNVDPDPAEAAALAAERGIRIVSLGVGTAAGSTLDLDGFRVDTRLDEGALRRLADITAGSYAPATEGDPAGAAYDELGRDLVLREEPVELTALVSALALVLLVAGVALSLARTGRLP